MMTRENLKKWIKENLTDINDKISSAKLKKNIASNFIDEIVKQTSFLEIDSQIISRIYCIEHDIYEQPICLTCNRPTKYQKTTKKYSQYCCKECISKSTQTKEKKKTACLKKWGVNNFFQTRQFKENTKETCLKKYGVEHYSKTQQHKNLINQNFSKSEEKRKRGFKDYIHNDNKIKLANKKREQTCLQKYGVVYIQNNPAIKEKTQKTSLQKYGYSNPAKAPEIIEKIKNTLEKRYSIECGNNGYVQQKEIPYQNLQKLYDKEWLLDQHLNLKKSLKQISLELNVSHSLVQQYFKYFQIKVNGLHHSLGEKEIIHFLTSFYKNPIISNTRDIISPKELDVYLPEHKLAIEFDGIYHHSKHDKNYHLQKTNACLNKNINLLHIYDIEWEDNKTQKIWKSILNTKLNNNINRIFARKTKIKEITAKEAADFLEMYHLQGNIFSKVNIGLYKEEELVAVMTFSKPRFNKKYEWELVRFANKFNTRIIGGASKLLKYFEHTRHPKSIITYADRRYSNGSLYGKLEFSFSHASSPNYQYYKNNKLFNRLQFQKHKLKNLLDLFDPALTEKENMLLNGYSLLYDCGNLVYIKNFDYSNSSH